MAKSKFDIIDRFMFFGAPPIIFERASELRNNLTDAENHLWEFLKDNQILGLHFRQQHPINYFIADFYCHKIKLVIEVDGKVHLTQYNKEHDEGRTYEIEKYGITIVRFSNEEVLCNSKKVVLEITNKCIELIGEQH